MAKQTQQFNAEIKQLLDIVIHSLYSHKEIFLRELISNASDALDKAKFQSLTQSDLLPAEHEFEIRLEADAAAKTLKISDTGIGMSPDEVVQFIGTIAKSGTKAFSQMNTELKNRPELIGQFGVGFYSSFMVADRVILHTQKAGTQEGTLWESSGDGSYSIDSVPRAGGAGTSITLFLKQPTKDAGEKETKTSEDSETADFTDEWTLRSLVKKYSDFISWPIKMKTKDEDQTLNSQKALWLRPSQEIKSEEYKEFYQHLSHDFNEPAKWVHYKAEGNLEFTSLLYFPKQKPFNYQTREHEYGLNLYAKKVFIMANCQDLLPAYLRFVKGLVDSSDLSLNVSREILQQDRQVQQIRKNIINKILTSLKDTLTKERSTYEEFFNHFGTTLKEGVPSDRGNLEKIQDLLLFRSSKSESWTTLNEYLNRMPEEQKEIFYISGDRLDVIRNSPYLEKLKAKGFEVLFLTDAIDEWVTQDILEYKGKKLVSIAKEGLKLGSDEELKRTEEEKKNQQERFGSLIETMKKNLHADVKDVVISDRLTETPACLVFGEHDLSSQMQKILSQMGQAQGPVKKILEINLKHSIFENMLSLPEDQQKTWSEILYNQALLTEGSPLPDPAKFSRMISSLMVKSN